MLLQNGKQPRIVLLINLKDSTTIISIRLLILYPAVLSTALAQNFIEALSEILSCHNSEKRFKIICSNLVILWQLRILSCDFESSISCVVMHVSITMRAL